MTPPISPPTPSRHSHSPPAARTGGSEPASAPASRGGWRPDLQASLVVFVVALPLSLGIAVASGAPVAAGLLAAAVGGLVAGALGGAPLQVSGPAAGLTVIVANLVSTYGWRVTCLITAGNFDPAEFDNPRQFRMDRQGNRHFTFSGGPHRCLGSHLARRELKIALEEFFARVPTFRLADDDTGLVNPGLQSARHVKLAW